MNSISAILISHHSSSKLHGLNHSDFLRISIYCVFQEAGKKAMVNIIVVSTKRCVCLRWRRRRAKVDDGQGWFLFMNHQLVLEYKLSTIAACSCHRTYHFLLLTILCIFDYMSLVPSMMPNPLKKFHAE